MMCPYCLRPSIVKLGAQVYPNNSELAMAVLWRCEGCDAHVGCHNNDPRKPFGRLANKELRRARMRAHAAFDPLWKKGEFSRAQAYGWLSKQMGVKSAHIGSFDLAQCAQVTELVLIHKHQYSTSRTLSGS